MLTRWWFYFQIILLLIIFSVSHLKAQTSPPELHQIILQGKKQLYDFQFQQAQQTFERAIAQYPEFPHGYFNRTYLMLIIYSQDMTNDSLEKELDGAYGEALEVANRYRDDHPREAEAYFYLGLSYGLKGIHNVLHRNYLKAYWYGKKGKDYLEQTVKMDSTFNDAYLGLGMFHYYVDLLPGVLKIVATILGFEGDKEKGKWEIGRTASKGKFFKEEALFAYQILRYFLEGDKQNPVQVFEQLAERYPNNPALKLLIGYHYRRIGYVDRAMEYFQSVPDTFTDLLPQITNIKYYNLAVCHFDKNEFQESDSLFNILLSLPTRKTPYYQAAIAYYKGLLADLQFDRATAEAYYNKIFLNKETQYWYYAVQMFKRFPMDSLMREYIINRNLLYSRQFAASLSGTLRLLEKSQQASTLSNPDLPVLAMDLLAEIYYYTNNLRESFTYFEKIYPQLEKFNDQFRKSWVLIHYARCLRDLKDYDRAAKLLEEARKTDDEYTRLIIEREKYILKQLQNNQKRA